MSATNLNLRKRKGGERREGNRAQEVEVVVMMMAEEEGVECTID